MSWFAYPTRNKNAIDIINYDILLDAHGQELYLYPMFVLVTNQQKNLYILEYLV